MAQWQAVTRPGGPGLELSGDLDAVAARSLPELLAATGGTGQLLTLDVRAVGRVSVAGLRALAREQHRRSVRGGALVLLGTPSGLARQLAGAGLAGLLESPRADRERVPA